MSLQEKKEELKKELEELERFEKHLYKGDTYKLTTNTAFLQNSKITEIFDLWKGFPDFIKKKHEGSWKNENSSEVEITFKVLPVKKPSALTGENKK